MQIKRFCTVGKATVCHETLNDTYANHYSCKIPHQSLSTMQRINTNNTKLEKACHSHTEKEYIKALLIKHLKPNLIVKTFASCKKKICMAFFTVYVAENANLNLAEF